MPSEKTMSLTMHLYFSQVVSKKRLLINEFVVSDRRLMVPPITWSFLAYVLCGLVGIAKPFSSYSSKQRVADSIVLEEIFFNVKERSSLLEN